MFRQLFHVPALALALVAAWVLAPAALAQTGPPMPSEDEVPIALLVDVTSGQVLYARNPDRRFVPASITKVMTLFLAFERIEQGTLDPLQMFTMNDEVWRAWNGEGSTMWIGAGESVAVDNLLMGIANVSANDAAVLLAEGHAGSVAGWVDAMNAEARKLGLASSHFGTPNGWPDEGATFTTARDLVALGEALVRRHPDKYRRYIGLPGFAWNGIEQPNRDPLLGRLRGADGIKTGYTNEAGYGFLGSAQRGGQRLMLVVAGADRGSKRSRAALDLMEWGFSAFERAQVFADGARIGAARVQNGSARRVGLRAERGVFVNVPRGRAGELRAAITYDGPVRAPIDAGERIATLVVEAPGMEPAYIPLVAAESVSEAGFFARLFNGIMGVFG